MLGAITGSAFPCHQWRHLTGVGGSMLGKRLYLLRNISSYHTVCTTMFTSVIVDFYDYNMLIKQFCEKKQIWPCFNWSALGCVLNMLCHGKQTNDTNKQNTNKQNTQIKCTHKQNTPANKPRYAAHTNAFFRTSHSKIGRNIVFKAKVRVLYPMDVTPLIITPWTSPH